MSLSDKRGFGLIISDFTLFSQEDDSNCPPTNNWWKSAEPRKCKCGEIKEIFNELLLDDRVKDLFRKYGMKSE